MNREPDADEQSRRSFITKSLYVVPVVLSLKAAPAFASYGSGKPVEDSDKPAKGWGKPPDKPVEHSDKSAKGSGKPPNNNGNNGLGNGVDPQPPGNPPVNDGAGTSPGQSGRHR